MDDTSLDRLLSGDLNKLPKLPKRVVRLFISSTFTDMTLERNSLMERVYPKLKKYCRERHGLDFQVVDMRWGVRDEATDDHQTVNLCSKEIENCQRVSLGPNFIALIGDKYGFRPLLNRIRSTEYRSLRRCLIESDINTDFLDTWYKEDLNAVPAEYLLQPISSILKNFTNKSEPELQMVDQRIWQAIQGHLHDLLLIGSSRLVKQGRMSERERSLKYSISVTEREVIEGCLDLNETKSHCLVYVRSIVDLRDQLNKYFEDLLKLDGNHQQLEPIMANGSTDSGVGAMEGRRDSTQRKASLKIGDDSITLTTTGPQTAAERKLERQRRLIGKYIDLTSKKGGAWQVDEDAQQALSELKEVKLKSKLSPNSRSLTSYQVHWNTQDGISVKSEEHKRYLDDLTDHFYENLTRMIRSAVKSERSKVETRGLIGEVLQHSHYSLQVGKRVHGRSFELNMVRDYILTGSCLPAGQSQLERNRAEPVLPMFLYGVSGSGKTSVLARVATLAHDWIRQSTARRRSSSASDQTVYGLTSTPTRQQDQPASNRWDRQPCIIMRFCCTTPASSSVVGMLTSVCRQLQYNFYQFGSLNGLMDDQTVSFQSKSNKSMVTTKWGKTLLSSKRTNVAAAAIDQIPYQHIPEDFVRLVYTFRQLLENCRHPLHKRRIFVIIIDSIERLSSPAECSVEAKFSWLTNISMLPPNVRLVASCGSSGATKSELYDYLHLKKHFLRAHMRHVSEARQKDDAELDRDSSDEEQSSSSDLSDPHTPPLNERPTSRYQFLKRLVLPATRLARGSRGLLFHDNNEVSGTGQFHKPAVRFTVKAVSTASLGSDGGDIPGNLARVSSSESLQSGHRSRSQQVPFQSSGLLHVRPLGRELGQSVLRRWLAESGRNLSHQQWAIVDRSLSHCSRPIFVKLAFGEVINWKSYSMRGDTRGFTFGSAWLTDFKPSEKSQLDLERLVSCRDEEAARNADNELKFKWQMLAMEQQWLNYLDYKSSKANDEQRHNDNGNNQGEASVCDHVIRIGMGVTSRNQTGAGGAQKSSSGAAVMGSSSLGAAGSASICHLSGTIEDAICQLFARIELKHGYLLTKHSLSYITAARNGICENELEDILSLDDVVLDDVFQYHLPPVRRIPPLLWTRIRNDFPDYLSERDADGIVLTWHHGQFKTVTEKRYLASERQLVYVHSLMADYFLGKWADKPKPFRCTKQQVQMAAEQLESAIQQSMRRDSDQGGPPYGKRQSSLTGNRGARLGSGSGASRSGASFSLRNRLRSSDQHDQRLQWMQAKAHRRVPHQPLYYESDISSGLTGAEKGKTAAQDNDRLKSGDENQPDNNAPSQPTTNRRTERRYNLRKLTELPFHLLRSGRFLDLASQTIFNYRWLFAIIDALGLQSLFADLNEAASQLESELTERQAALELDEGERSKVESEADVFNADELAVTTRDKLTIAALNSLNDQLATLNSTLRLSASVVHSNPQQLAPQLIGRLLQPPSAIANNSISDQGPGGGAGELSASLNDESTSLGFIEQLLEQCDRDGCSDCALLPIDHCLQSADGLQLSSLEGHPFGVLSMCLASDQRHLLAASSKFLMWNISTGEIARDVDPRLNGAIIRQLLLSSSNKFALAYTSDNLILSLEILTQQVAQTDLCGLRRRLAESRVYNSNQNNEGDDDLGDQIAGMKLIDELEASRFFVWMNSGLVLVLRLEEVHLDVDQQQDQNGAATSVSVSLHYEIDYLKVVNNGPRSVSRILEVSIEQISESSDLVLILACSDSMNPNEMHLTSIKVSHTQSTERTIDDLQMWSRLDARLIALGLSLRQLILETSTGDILLSRRRTTRWSKGKLLSATKDAGDDSRSMLAIELEAGSRAIDPEDEHGDRGLKETPVELYERLAEFERNLDGDCEEIQPLHLAFSNACRRSLTARENVVIERRARFAKLYYSDRIDILQLDRPIGMPDRTNSNYERRSMMLPRDIRNVSLDSNRCQLSSKIVLKDGVESFHSEHYLIVVATRRLLVYSLESEQLLKCIEAHASRITSLIPIQTLALKPGSNDGPRLGTSALVTSSMDRTVKIWNLMNLEKDGKAIVRLGSSSSGSRQFDSICLNSQRPLAACISRGQLSLWDWQSSSLVHSYECIEELTLVASDKQADTSNYSKITKCKFSRNGRYLALSSVSKKDTTIHLMALEGLTHMNNARNDGASLSCQEVRLRRVAFRPLQREHSVLKLKFLVQDSRLLVVSQVKQGETVTKRMSGAESSSPSHVDSSLDSVQIGSEPNSGVETEASKLIDRLFIHSLTVPELRNLYTIECTTPKSWTDASKSHGRLLSNKSTEVGNRAHGQQNRGQTWINGTTDGGLMMAITGEQQFLIVAGVKPGLGAVQSESHRSDEKRSSSLNRMQPVLNVYTAKDGRLTRTIYLNQLQVAQQQQPHQRPEVSRLVKSSSVLEQPDKAGKSFLQASADSVPRRNSQKSVEDHHRSGFVAIHLGQFNRLKAVSNRDRQSIVALMDDERGLSWFVDVSTRMLVAQSNSWSGKLSFDGRYGLSRMFTNTSGGGDGESSLSSGGLRLLEMRHCRPTKCLLTLDEFNSLTINSVRPVERVGGSSGVTRQSELICGFSRPNDTYVYFCDPRTRQLVLMRLRDSQLLANYRLPSAPSRIKCSGDGLAFVVGLSDGALLSLAIVDPLASETLTRLSQYPSRKMRKGRNKK